MPRDNSIYGNKADWKQVGDAVHADRFAIWCVFSGSFDTKQAWMKGDDGRVKRFDDEAAAQAEADHWNARMNDKHSRGRFTYTVRPYGLMGFA